MILSHRSYIQAFYYFTVMLVSPPVCFSIKKDMAALYVTEHMSTQRPRDVDKNTHTFCD